MEKESVVGVVERFIRELQVRGIRPQTVIPLRLPGCGNGKGRKRIDVVVISETFPVRVTGSASTSSVLTTIDSGATLK